MSLLELDDFSFHPLKEGDFLLLFSWLQSPHMRGLWDDVQSLADVRRQFQDKIGSATQNAYIVYLGGQAFAYVQSYQASSAGAGWWPGESSTTVGIDQFIGVSSFLGRGIGTRMVRVFSDWILSRGEVLKVITDPKPGNQRAIRCYRNAGFQEVGLVQTPDGLELLMEKKKAP